MVCSFARNDCRHSCIYVQTLAAVVVVLAVQLRLRLYGGSADRDGIKFNQQVDRYLINQDRFARWAVCRAGRRSN